MSSRDESRTIEILPPRIKVNANASYFQMIFSSRNLTERRMAMRMENALLAANRTKLQNGKTAT